MQSLHHPQENMVSEKMTMKKPVAESNTSSTQNFDPITNFGMHITSIHCHCDDYSKQLMCHGYASVVNEDLTQALIYDGCGKTAKLVGIEYIISEKVFKSLPDEETKFWHSHSYVLKSGVATCPGLSMEIEKKAMKNLATTYGKTFHFWQVERGDKFPIGVPQVMMVPIKDEQVNWKLVEERDKAHDTDYKKLKKERAEFEDAKIDSRADAWARTGKAVELEVKEISLKID